MGKSVKKSSSSISSVQHHLARGHFANPKKSYLSSGYPYDQFKWHRVDCEIKDENGHTIFQQKNVEAPQNWSQRAVEIAASKYFRKGHEGSIRQLIHRVVQTIAKRGLQQKVFSNNAEKNIFANELATILLSQRAAFNSPVWFNVGLNEEYKIRGQGEFYHWSPIQKKVLKSDFAYVYPQASACFIQGLEDSLDSIYQLSRNEGRIFKYGSGSGTNFSALRSHEEHLSQGGTSSGLLSFLDFFDRGAAAIKSGGTTRRAAKMVCLDVDHPEIEEFIAWKMREEKKAQILIQNGYSSDFEGEAYRTVSGQNANNSVRITEKFIQAVNKNSDWHLKSRTNGKKIKTLEAQKIWQDIAEAAWACAEPGVQFHDTIQSWHTCADTSTIQASNPCSEYMFINDSACNLASLNLLKFFTGEGDFLLEDFVQTVDIVLTAQEILVDLAGYPTELIAANSHAYRPLGIGYANLGALLMSRGIGYDTVDGRLLASYLTALLTGEAYRQSSLLAKKLGPFAAFKKNKGSFSKVLYKHRAAAQQLPKMAGYETLHFTIREIWNDVVLDSKKYGVRNAQVSAIAPTGTIGFLMDCETTGIEPEYALVKTKKMVGGGSYNFVSQALAAGLNSLGYSAEKTKAIVETVTEHGYLDENSGLALKDLSIFACAVSSSRHGQVLQPLAHLRMMAAVQPFVSGAISKTVNIPNFASVEDVQQIFATAHELGLKSIAIYRDGCKMSQPLFSQKGLPKCPACGEELSQTGGCLSCSNCGLQLSCG